MTRLSEAELDRFADLGRKEGTVVVFVCDLSDLVTELRERRAAESQPAGTVKVRIAVAVNAYGEWSADGADSWQDGYAINAAMTAVAGDSRVTFVTAYAPLPEPPAEVAGSVEVGDV